MAHRNSVSHLYKLAILTRPATSPTELINSLRCPATASPVSLLRYSRREHVEILQRWQERVCPLKRSQDRNGNGEQEPCTCCGYHYRTILYCSYAFSLRVSSRLEKLLEPWGVHKPPARPSSLEGNSPVFMPMPPLDQHT